MPALQSAMDVQVVGCRRRAGVWPAAPRARCPRSNPRWMCKSSAADGERASRPLPRGQDGRAPIRNACASRRLRTESGRLARCPAGKMAALRSAIHVQVVGGRRRAGVSPAAPRARCPRSNPQCMCKSSAADGERASGPLPRGQDARAPIRNACASRRLQTESGRLARCPAGKMPALRSAIHV